MFNFIKFKLFIVLVALSTVFAFAAPAQKADCKWDAKLRQAFVKYEKYINGQYEADDADILLPLGHRKMNCLLDSMLKKEKYDYNLDVLLWLTFIPDSVFYLSPASVKYLVNDKNVYRRNAARMLLHEKQHKKYSIDKKIIRAYTKAKDFIEYLIYEFKPEDYEESW